MSQGNKHKKAFYIISFKYDLNGFIGHLTNITLEKLAKKIIKKCRQVSFW